MVPAGSSTTTSTSASPVQLTTTRQSRATASSKAAWNFLASSVRFSRWSFSSVALAIRTPFSQICFCSAGQAWLRIPTVAHWSPSKLLSFSARPKPCT